MLGSLAERAIVQIANLPSCATDCLASAYSDMNGYSCAHVANNKIIESCVLNACSLPEAIFARNVTETACGTPVEDKSVQFLAVNIVFGLMTAGFVALRLGFRLFFSQRQGYLDFDDFLILLASPLAIASLAVLLKGLWENGLGKSVWAVDARDMSDFGKYLYIMELLYLMLLTLIKITLSIFYLAIFPGKNVRRLLWITMSFHVAFGVAFMFKGAFQCHPISYSWTRFDTAGAGSIKGSCVDINASGWVNASVNVAVDFWLIAIPLVEIRKLNLHWKKKIGAALMFMTGLLVTIISILRLNSLRHYANTSNPTYDDYGVVLWSAIEVNIGLICTCLPSIRLILFRLFPTLLSTTQRSDGSARTPDPSSKLSSQYSQPLSPTTLASPTEEQFVGLNGLPKPRPTAWKVSHTTTGWEVIDEESADERASFTRPARLTQRV